MYSMYNIYIYNIIVQTTVDQSLTVRIFVHEVVYVPLLYFLYCSQKYLTSPFLVIDFNTFDIFSGSPASRRYFHYII